MEKHKQNKTKERNSWEHMKQRCSNPNNNKYHIYGGKGVKVCDRWLLPKGVGLKNFIEDMGYAPSPIHSIDRYPNKEGNYEPTNCRWATKVEQGSNTCRNVWLTLNGKTQTMNEWSKELKINVTTMIGRRHRGWSTENVLSTNKYMRDRMPAK